MARKLATRSGFVWLGGFTSPPFFSLAFGAELILVFNLPDTACNCLLFTLINIKGESYRLKEKRKAGLLKNTPTTQGE